jgi:hypothetical protein
VLTSDRSDCPPQAGLWVARPTVIAVTRAADTNGEISQLGRRTRDIWSFTIFEIRAKWAKPFPHRGKFVKEDSRFSRLL